MFNRILSLSLLCLTVSGSDLPSWHNLNCEEGHKYLFSDETRPWQEARDECELYGGWLLDINSQREQNCLLRFAHSSGLHAGWFWHDGRIEYFLFSLCHYFPQRTMSLMKEFLFTPGITLTSLGSIIAIMTYTQNITTTYWVFLEKMTNLPGPGVMNLLHLVVISSVKDLYRN